MEPRTAAARTHVVQRFGISPATLTKAVRAFEDHGGMYGMLPKPARRQLDVRLLHPDLTRAFRHVIDEANRARRKETLETLTDAVRKFSPEIQVRSRERRQAIVEAIDPQGRVYQRVSRRHHDAIAARPGYKRVRAVRPMQYVLMDSTPLDIFALDRRTGYWVQVELTLAMDLFSRKVLALRLSAVNPTATDAAWAVCDILAPAKARPGIGTSWPLSLLPDHLVMPTLSLGEFGTFPGLRMQTLVVDRGPIFASQQFQDFCQRSQIEMLFARVQAPDDKPQVERMFLTLAMKYLIGLGGFKGQNVLDRPEDADIDPCYFVDELESLLWKWINEHYHRRPHRGLRHPNAPGLCLSPDQAFAEGLAVGGALRFLAEPDLRLMALEPHWREVRDQGVDFEGLLYDGPGLASVRGLEPDPPPLSVGPNKGKYCFRAHPYDRRAIWFRDAGGTFHQLTWVGADKDTPLFATRHVRLAKEFLLKQGIRDPRADQISDTLQQILEDDLERLRRKKRPTEADGRALVSATLAERDTEHLYVPPDRHHNDVSPIATRAQDPAEPDDAATHDFLSDALSELPTMPDDRDRVADPASGPAEPAPLLRQIGAQPWPTLAAAATSPTRTPTTTGIPTTSWSTSTTWPATPAPVRRTPGS